MRQWPDVRRTRRQVRGLLAAAGLLGAAREARDVVSSVPWLRDNWRFWRHGAPDGLPVPPLHLVRSSTGTSSLAWLFHGGALAADSITGVLARNGLDIRTFTSILDFGCGCGRVIRQWVELDAAVHGCDYNRRSVEWCRRHLAFASFDVNALSPPLPYGDGQFDLVYALSVFTHLPEPLLFAWVREMERVLKPGGVLIISTHGERYLGELTPDQQARFRAGAVVVKEQASAGTNLCGVYFSEPFIRTRFADGFRVLDFIPEGARGNPPQDLVLLQKRRQA
jgi:2-polyprenyl-3-methyl-5-hydroxy-6-metoxy-1,4-benzoquinol methylase